MSQKQKAVLFNEVFSKIEQQLKIEHDKKENIRANVMHLEEASRKVEILLQCMHQASLLDISTLCQECRELFVDVRKKYSTLAELIAKEEFFMYLHLWQNVTTKLCFLASLVSYLEDGKLATPEKVSSMLGAHVKQEDGFHIPLNDYLCGLLNLVSELARWSMNCVAVGNYSRPLAISKFVADIESGFRLLNLKNDFLRKKFDGLKYDVKKIEQVVYDMKIRNLVP